MRDPADLLERYEATGDEDAFDEALRLLERAIAERPDAALFRDYGYLLEAHGRHAIRQAVEHYRRAIELDPGADKPHYQLISAQAALGEADDAVARYEARVAAAPTDVREYRLLACALLVARDHERAAAVIDAGLDLAPEDRTLIEQRGDVKAARGEVEGALADWRRALDPDNHHIAGAYSSAFLLEREGRLAEAADAWRYILGYNESRGYDLQAEWPRRELERLRALQR